MSREFALAAPSFNGRTAASGAAYRGSNPWGQPMNSITYSLSPKPLHSVSTPCQHFSRVPFGGPGAAVGDPHTLRCTSGTRKLIAISGGPQGGSGFIPERPCHVKFIRPSSVRESAEPLRPLSGGPEATLSRASEEHYGVVGTNFRSRSPDMLRCDPTPFCYGLADLRYHELTSEGHDACRCRENADR